MALDEIDLLDLDRWVTEGVPHRWFDELRRDAPVWRHPAADGGPGFWVVSRYHDVVTAGRKPELLSSDAERGGVTALVAPAPSHDISDVRSAAIDRSDAKSLLLMDPPEHTQYRKLVNKGFTPRMTARMAPRVRALVNELLDQVDGADVVDFVEHVSVPLPLTVIAELLGVPRADQPKVLQWTNMIAAPTDTQADDPDATVLTAFLEFSHYVDALRAERGESPADDLISDLISARVDGHELSQLRFQLFVVLLAAAGNETTRNAMSHGVVAFAEHPDAYDRLRADPSLIPTAVEEILRWASPVMYFRRTAVADMDLGGQRIEAGDIVSLWYTSANRDDDVFERPHDFDITRDPNPHIAFGGGGPHFCLGASLARLEIAILLEELVRRVRCVEVAGPVVRVRTNFLNGLNRVPIRLHWGGAP